MPGELQLVSAAGEKILVVGHVSAPVQVCALKLHGSPYGHPRFGEQQACFKSYHSTEGL